MHLLEEGDASSTSSASSRYWAGMAHLLNAVNIVDRVLFLGCVIGTRFFSLSLLPLLSAGDGGSFFSRLFLFLFLLCKNYEANIGNLMVEWP